MKNKLIALLMLTMSLTSIAASNNIEFTVMHGAGGVSDLTTRYIANHLDNNYIVVNRPGAGGQIALNHLLKDNTMMLATMVQVFVTNPLNFENLNYNYKQDLEVVSVIGVMPSALVCNKKTGFKSFNDFLQSNKPVSFGFGGYGSSEHVATAVLVSKTNLNSTLVPYAQGGNKAVVDLLGGHIDCMFANFPTIKPHLANENLILLMTSHDIGYNVVQWNKIYKSDFPFQSYLSIIVPTAMDNSIKQKITQDLKNSVNDSYREGMKNLGIFPLLITDRSKIKDVVNYMETIKEFILKNNIKTTG